MRKEEAVEAEGWEKIRKYKRENKGLKKKGPNKRRNRAKKNTRNFGKK